MNPESKIEKYDVVILGSGLGGLACGAILSKEEMKVCIIEKNEQIGGNLQTFIRDGIRFDTGVHYVGGLDKGQNLYRLFNYLGIMDRLKIQKMDPTGFDVVMFKEDAQEYPYGMGYDNFIMIMTEKFPDEKAAIVNYCNTMQEICNNFPLYNIRISDNYENKKIFTLGAREYISSLTGNRKLQNVLAGTNLLYAGIGHKTPLYVHALVVNSYIESSWRCCGGGDQIAKLLAKEIIRKGGVIKRKNRVKKIQIESGKVNYVELQSGDRIHGKNFISNIHPAQTLEMIDGDKVRPIFKRRIKNLENSPSAFIIYAVLKPNRRKYQNRNYYYFDEIDVWKGIDYTSQTWPYAYAMFECVPRNPGEYLEGLSVISYMRFEEVKEWESTHNTSLHEGDRGKEYEIFKRAKSEKLLSVLEHKFPGIREDIQSYYTATPLSFRDYIGTNDGNLYGVIKDVNDPLITRISPRTKIPNLLFTGQNVNLHGVLGVTLSAVLTCSMLIGKEYLINKIAEANEKFV